MNGAELSFFMTSHTRVCVCVCVCVCVRVYQELRCAQHVESERLNS